MSLQELVGPSLHLKLSIREGHGFGFLKSPIVIVAGTNGIFLETEVVPPSPDPSFLIDLVWETDKKSLRRFRASNTPVKLECFTVDANNHRESIGSILLNIKSAQVIVGSSQANVNDKWYKLIGVPADAKALQPELLLSLTIQEPNSLSQPLSQNTWESQGAVDNLPAVKKSKTNNSKMDGSQLTALHSSSASPCDSKLGYIQLGPETSCVDTFSLVICVKQTFDMHLLLPQHQNLCALSSEVKPFQISFSLMNQSLKTNSFGDKNWEKICQVNEEVVLPLRTSLPNLHAYLQENPCVTLCLLYCGQEVAVAEVHIRSLVPTNDIGSFSHEFNGKSAFTQKCILVSSKSGSIPYQDGLHPAIEVLTKLLLTASPSVSYKPPIHFNHSKPILDTKFQPLTAGQAVGEDQYPRSESRQSQDTFIVTSQSGPVWVPVASSSIQSQPLSCKDYPEKIFKITDNKTIVSSNLRAVKIQLNKVTFSSPPRASQVRFVFECPNSSVSTSACTDVLVTHSQEALVLEDVCAKISGQLLSTIQIHLFEIGINSSTSHFASAKIFIDDFEPSEKDGSCRSLVLTGSLSRQIVGILTATVKFEETSERKLLKNENEGIFPLPCSPLCTVTSTAVQPHQVQVLFNEVAEKATAPVHHGEMTLNPQVHELIQNDLQRTATMSTPLQNPLNSDTHLSTDPMFLRPTSSSAVPFDSKTAYRIVEELEDWKEKQQEIFLAECKKKETEHIAHKTEKLNNKMEVCAALAQSLSNTKQDLRDRLKTCAIKEQEFKKAKEQLDCQYNLKFQELTLAAKRLDEGFKIKVSSIESKCSKLEERLKELEAENEQLRRQLQQQTTVHATHAGDHACCGMSHGQVTGLLAQVDQLEGKLKSSLQSKAYFQEQWGRAIREMNQAKLQFSQSIEKNNSIENLLGKEEEELQHDKNTLEKLRQDLACYDRF